MRIKPWYFRRQQNWVIFLQVYVTHFEYWLFSKFSHLTPRQNKSRPGGEIFCIWTRGNNIFSPGKRKNNGKTIFIWTAPKKKNLLQNASKALLQNELAFFIIKGNSLLQNISACLLQNTDELIAKHGKYAYICWSYCIMKKLLRDHK